MPPTTCPTTEPTFGTYGFVATCSTADVTAGASFDAVDAATVPDLLDGPTDAGCFATADSASSSDTISDDGVVTAESASPNDVALGFGIGLSLGVGLTRHGSHSLDLVC